MGVSQGLAVGILVTVGMSSNGSRSSLGLASELDLPCPVAPTVGPLQWVRKPALEIGIFSNIGSIPRSVGAN